MTPTFPTIELISRMAGHRTYCVVSGEGIWLQGVVEAKPCSCTLYATSETKTRPAYVVGVGGATSHGRQKSLRFSAEEIHRAAKFCTPCHSLSISANTHLEEDSFFTVCGCPPVIVQPCCEAGLSILDQLLKLHHTDIEKVRRRLWRDV